jgi:hypothetical protein
VSERSVDSSFLVSFLTPILIYKSFL